MVSRKERERPIVHKFGGGALQDGRTMARAARLLARQPGTKIVVASALQGVSDRLAAAVAVPPSEGDVAGLIEALRRQHMEALREAAPSKTQAPQRLDETLEHLERLLYGIAFTQEVTPRLADLLQSYGERLSVTVLAAALAEAGVPARALDAEGAGLHSSGPFGNARPDLERIRTQVPTALRPLLDDGRIPVVTGYYGVDPDGNATLFGRGGSDFVASLVAAAMDAEQLVLWKDVPGFMTADPKAVPDAALVPELGYDEAAELAYFGSRLLHPRAVEPVEAAGVPIHIRSFDDPDAPGSVIRADVPIGPRSVRSAASRDGLAIVRLRGPGMVHAHGVARRVFDALDDADVNVLNMANSQASFALLMDGSDAFRAEAALRPLVGGAIQQVDVLQERSLVCVVGRGLGATPGSAASILHAVAQADVNVEMISLGASDIAIDFIVASSQRAAALQALHDAYLLAPEVAQ